jgi:hypothetical protein
MPARKTGGPSLLAMAFGDEPLGPWDHRFTFGEDLGCAFPFLGFVVFVVVVTILWQYFFN